MKKYSLLAVLILVSVLAIAGTNNLPTETGRVIQREHVNKFKEALSGDLVPRNASGTVADQGGTLGTSTVRWGSSYLTDVHIGATTSGLSIEESSGALSFKVGGVEKMKITSDGLVEGSLDVGATAGIGDVAKSGIVNGATCSGTSFSNCSDGTNTLSVTITTSGRPVRLFLNPETSGCAGTIAGYSTDGEIDFRYTRNGTEITRFRIRNGNGGTASLTFGTNYDFGFTDTPAAGTWTYVLQGAELTLAGSDNNFFCMTLMAYEL